MSKTQAKKSDARQRIVETAERLFYAEGVRAVGIDRIINKELRFYANYATVSNGTAAAVTPWTEGRSTNVAGSAGKDGKGLSLGMRYDF